MKRYLILMGLILIMASVTFFSPKALSEELLIKHPIPFGWKFKDLEMGEKYIGICFWPDIELNGHEPQIFPRTLVQILDKKSGRVILEVKTEAGERFKLLKDNKIFLVKGKRMEMIQSGCLTLMVRSTGELNGHRDCNQ
ncbi:MAG TPA: hypothetical protein ENO29_03710 [Candidatus Aminicenantes bacterium]|nr:hypothetical protein [Candidatus Aminicenantes bacterium]